MLFNSILGALAATLLKPAHASRPVVDLSYGQYQGYTNETSGLTYFLGMRYAAAPVEHLRFNIPNPPPSISGVQDASKYGAACLQQNLSAPSLSFPGVGPINPGAGIGKQSEDCLFVNVIKPNNVTLNTKLPVVFWIFGGGFEVGDTSQNDGTPIVERSIALGEPVIYVSANYRLNAYGFLGSKEIKAAGVGNMGLRDQRYAMEWVQRNIHLFGGDKDKVTIWGWSSGAWSIGTHLVLNKGNPAGLFRGAFMNSGSPLPASDITAGQKYYDILVNNTGCSSSNDTLECLRGVPAEIITDIVTTKTPNFFSYQSIQIAYLPRVDGDFIKENPQDSIAKGEYAKVPFVTGVCHDEGTQFALPNGNITTGVELLDYVHRNYLPNASVADIREIARLYPNDPTKGSPFGTGNSSGLFPQYKRLSAINGDLIFQGPRRYLIEAASKTQNVWVFDYRRSDALTPELGFRHGADGHTFGFSGTTPDSQGIDAVVNFVNHLTPTPPNQTSALSSVHWPTWGSNLSRPALTFWDPAVLNVTSDTEREEQVKGLTALSRKFPLGFTDLAPSA